MDDDDQQPRLLALTTEIVASFAGNHPVAAGDLPGLISGVFQALRAAGRVEADPPAEAPTPAVPVRKSVGHEFLVYLEDGKKLKTLKRHLAATT